MRRRNFTDAIIRRVSDGDFHLKMASASFFMEPREEVTVGDMDYHYQKSLMGEIRYACTPWTEV